MRSIGFIAGLVFVSGTLYSVLSPESAGSAEPETGAPAAGASIGTAERPTSGGVPEAARSTVSEGVSNELPDASVVEDFKRQRAMLDARMKELAAKEAELKARETALDEELKKLGSIREDIAKIESARKKEGDEKVTKLVETIEAMNPKAASQLLGSVDESLAVAAIARMSTAKLAKVMNVMEPGKSSRLTELMAGVVRAKGAPKRSELSASDGAPVATKNGKGGEKQNDGQSEQQ